MTLVAAVLLFAGLVLAQPAPIPLCLLPPGTTSTLAVVPCPVPTPAPPTLAQIVAVLPTVPIATLAKTSPGALYFTLDQVNAITLCVAGTTSPGCPTPVAAAMIMGPNGRPAPTYAFSATDPTGAVPGPVFWLRMRPLNGSPSNP